MKAVPEPPNGMIDYGPPESRPSTRTAHSPGESSFITAESPSTDRYYGVTDSSAEESGTERDVADHTLSDDSEWVAASCPDLGRSDSRLTRTSGTVGPNSLGAG